MTIVREISCTTKRDLPASIHKHILSVGGVEDGMRWRMSQLQVIEAIENNTYSFHITRGKRSIAVLVSMSRYGHKYIKTRDDGEQPDNLLKLPSCP